MASRQNSVKDGARAVPGSQQQRRFAGHAKANLTILVAIACASSRGRLALRCLYQAAPLVAVALLAGCASDKPPRATSTEPEKVPITTATTPAPAPAPVEPPTPPALERKVIRIDAGSSKPYTDSSGNVWLPDQGFLGGDVVTREDSMPIENTKDPALYRTEHWGMTGFSQSVPNGKYLVKLHFAETYSQIQGPEGRLFGMTVEGQEFSNFDVWAKAGGPQRAYIEEVNVNVADQKLDISFEMIADSPEINAIEIIPVPNF